MVAAWEFFETVQEIIDEGMCLPEQVFFFFFFLMWMRQDCTGKDARLKLHR